MKISRLLAILSLTLSLFFIGQAQTPTPTPTPTPIPNVVGEVNVTTKFANSDPLYQQIRQNLDKKTLGEVATVNNLILQKEMNRKIVSTF